MSELMSNSLILTRFFLILTSVLILVRCLRSLLSERYEGELWATLKLGRDTLPVTHWENLIGRSRSADIRVDRDRVRRIHAVLKRGSRGKWAVYNVFGRSGVTRNGVKVGSGGASVQDGDVIGVGSARLRFQALGEEKRGQLERQRTSAGKRVSPGGTLTALTLFQLFLLLQHALHDTSHLRMIALGFGSLIALEWFCYSAMRLLDRSGFEIETIAFYLSSLGMSVAASAAPDALLKQIVLMIAGVLLFLLLGWWLRSLRRVTAVRGLVGLAALGLLAANLLLSEEVFGARNWLSFGGYSFQPSEFVKVCYLYVGASTLDLLYRRRNLFSFIAFSAVCVAAMALIGDFGTALVFFICFLVISFLRSGSIATVLLAVTGAAMAGFLAVSMRPHIAQRFTAWGHVWEDVYGAGYQQARAMSAAAAGGLFGKGAGAGWLKNVFAGDTDLAFAVICEEQGLLVALCMVLAVMALAFFAVRAARYGRSSFYAIAACGAAAMLLTQTALHVFGSMDLLPFTGVTFPFVSRGGSSLLCCWMLMAFLKGSDTRRGASFVVEPVPVPDGKGEGTMKKITRRAVSVVLIAAMIIAGLVLYTLRYIDHGRDWALAFARANSGSSGELTDRNGLLLASFDASENRYAEDPALRTACYHVTGDYWGRTSTGALTRLWSDMYGYSLLTGTTHARSSDLQLTVDAELCRTAYEALDGRKGAVMLMNYRTGELLCMVSGPSLDPLSDEEPPEGAFINRCLSASFVPGSIFKLVTAAAAIETLPDIDRMSFFCENELEIEGVPIICPGPHYTQTFEQALANSCNIAFAVIAIRVGQERMIEHVRAYGLLDTHELDGIPSAAGNYPLDFVGDPELGWSGIGQSTDLVNPYAMLRFVAAVANSGVLVEPHLIAGEEVGSARLVETETAQRLASMMSYNVAAHYADEVDFHGLPLCAKTGTAELGEELTSHAWFVGFLADTAHPYAFVVLVENGGGGLSVAGPVASAVLQKAVQN